MEIVRANQLSKQFATVTAVDSLSFTVRRGEIVALVGPDGAGKTTTMRMLASVMRPSSGDAWVCGFHTVAEAEQVKRRIGYVSQQFGLYADLSVMENVRFYADVYCVPRCGFHQRAETLLEFSGLAPFRRRLAQHLSGGMKQKLSLVCALIHTPEVLLLDEPTNGVDPVSRRDFWRILYQLSHREQVTVFLSTAYLDEAERAARVALIHNGQLLAYGSPAEVKQLVHQTILEIRCTQPRRAAALLRKELPPAAVSQFGDRIHVAADPAGRVARAVQQVLEAAGIEATEIRPVEPSLEDVFVWVLGDAERE